MRHADLSARDRDYALLDTIGASLVQGSTTNRTYCLLWAVKCPTRLSALPPTAGGWRLGGKRQQWATNVRFLNAGDFKGKQQSGLSSCSPSRH